MTQREPMYLSPSVHQWQHPGEMDDTIISQPENWHQYNPPILCFNNYLWNKRFWVLCDTATNCYK